MDSERVALRGKEVLGGVDYGDLKIKKGPHLVTPIGICLTGFDNNRHDFITLYLNDEAIRIYDNNRLTVMDVAAFKGVDPKKLLAKRGRDLTFNVNGQMKSIKGEPGVPANITVNGEVASLSTHVVMNDYITITEAKSGHDASMSSYQLIDSLNVGVTFDGTFMKLDSGSDSQRSRA